MISDERDGLRLDELLRQHYSLLVVDAPEQRQAVLTAFAEAHADRTTNPVRRRLWPARLAGLAAAVVVVAICVKMLLIPSSSARVYGLEAAGRRLCDVKTIRVRGVMFARHDDKPDSPPVRIPIENLIKRPDKFSHTWSSISQNGEVFEIRQGRRVCDGRHETILNDSDKQYKASPVSPIDARLTTELFGQAYLRFAVLGQPEAPYKKIGHEKINGVECDVYEARIEDKEFHRVTVDTLWFNPVSGYPVRKTMDWIGPDGKVVRQSEYDDISVNIPLADELFAPESPAEYERLGEASKEGDRPVPLSTTPTGSGGGGDNQQLSTWHALRISDHAALVTWRRSAPEPATDGTLDWLSQIEITFNGSSSGIRHGWVYQSGSPNVWNWSLVALVDRQLPDPATFVFTLSTNKHFVGIMNMSALRFPDDQLEQILHAAAAAALPEGAPRYSLAELRAKALALSKEMGAE
jgi:hypothetical protein